MSFTIGDAIVNAVNSDIVKKTFRNPIKVAVLMAILIMGVLTIIVWPQVQLHDSSTGGFMYFLVTTSLYTLIGSIAIIYLHDKVIRNEYDIKYQTGEVEDVVTSAIHSKD